MKSDHTGLGQGDVKLRIRSAEVPMVVLTKSTRVYHRDEPIPLAELEVTVFGSRGNDSVSVLAGLDRATLTELVERGQKILAGKADES